MAEEYARLELAQEVTAGNGVKVNQLVIMRPTCKALMEILDSGAGAQQVERLVSSSVRGLNGTADLLEINSADILWNDANELLGIIYEMMEDGAAVHLPPETGDGIAEPLVYTLRRPVKLTQQDDAEKLTQVSFMARRVREIGEFLDARGEVAQFRAFMRLFGTPLGLRVPIFSDALIDAIDYLDALVIRGPAIMGKFTRSQRRWKKTSSPLH